MESDNIETLLKKYFQAETSIAEENILKSYFSSTDVVPHLSHYIPMFKYLSQENETLFSQQIQLPSQKPLWQWFAIAASILLLCGVVTFAFFNYSSTDKHINKQTNK